LGIAFERTEGRIEMVSPTRRPGVLLRRLDPLLPSSLTAGAWAQTTGLPVTATFSGLVYDRATQTFNSVLTSTNTGTSALQSPLMIVISTGTAFAYRAATAPEEDTELGEVVVTAQKRAENIEMTPIAIGVIGSTQLEQGNIDQPVKLQFNVPSMTFGNEGGAINYDAFALIHETGLDGFIDDTHPLGVFSEPASYFTSHPGYLSAVRCRQTRRRRHRELLWPGSAGSGGSRPPKDRNPRQRCAKLLED